MFVAGLGSNGPSDTEVAAGLVLETLSTDGGEYELDLRGVSRDHAHAALEQMIEKPFDRARTVCVILEPPKGDGVESLFLPVGRHLRQALQDGRVTTVRPLNPETGGLGFWVSLPLRAEESSSADED